MSHKAAGAEDDALGLSGRRVFFYALPALPIGALSVPITVYIPPLYAEDTVLTLGLVGTLFTLSKIIDVFTDPLFGWISDRAHPRWGRRKTWMLAAIPVLLLAIEKLFHPPADAGATYLIVWLGLLYIGYTMTFLSHLAWGAELSNAYDDRSRTMGWRQSASIIGMLTVLILPAMAEIGGLVEGAQGRADIMARFILFALPLFTLIAAIALPDPLPVNRRPPTRFLAEMKSLLSLLSNHHLRRVLGADLLLQAAIGITGSLYIWLSVFVLNMGQFSSFILVVYFGAAILSIPLWMHFAQRHEKHTTLVLAMAYAVVTLCLFGLSPGQPVWAILLVNGLYGVAFGPSLFLCRAMIADIADEDQLNHGRARMGSFFSMLSLTSKFGAAFGPFIAYNLLEQVGFDPKGVVTQTQADWLLAVFILPTVTLFAIAGWIISRHTLTRARHADIRGALANAIDASTPPSGIADGQPAINRNDRTR